MAWRDSFRGIATRNVNPACLACGSEDIAIGDRRLVLIAVAERGNVAVSIDDAQATGMVCAPIICQQCGHVALYNLAAYE